MIKTSGGHMRFRKVRFCSGFLLALVCAAVALAQNATGSYIILPDKFQSGDSFLTHDLRVTRSIRITEKVRLNLIGEVFNIFNIANLTGYGGALNAYIRPISPSQTNPNGTPGRPPNQSEFTFGQPNNRVSPVFGTGGPRAFQLAARLSF